MIIEIALGIVLAVLILYFLPLILVAGVAVVGLLITVIVLGLFIYFVVSLELTAAEVEALLSVTVLVVILPIIVGIVVTRIPLVRSRLGEPEPLGWNGRLLGEYLFDVFKAYWLIGVAAGGLTILLLGLAAVANCELRILPIGIC